MCWQRRASSRWFTLVSGHKLLWDSFRAPEGPLSSYASLLVLMLQSRAPNTLMVPPSEIELNFVSEKDKRGRHERL